MSLASRRIPRVYSDAENAAPRQRGADRGVTKQYAGRTTRARHALGDISNQRGAGGARDGTKRRVLRPRRAAGGNHTSTRHAANLPVRQPLQAVAPQAAPVPMMDDVMDDDLDMNMELEDGVSFLNIRNNVDAADAHDPLFVTEYINDIMAYFKNTEHLRKPHANYMDKQNDINNKMREILIDWLVEVHLKFKLRQETMYLTVNIIDRFLQRRAVSRTKLQLVGCTAMLIASKYEEIFAPEVRDFVYISDKAYTRDQILAMESIMLNALQFNLTVPSSLRFAQRYCKVANATEEVTHFANYFMERTMQDYKFLKYLPSMIAASAVYLALKVTGHSAWGCTMQQHTEFTENDMSQCAREMLAVAAQESPKYKAVKKKYSSPKFHQVSRHPLNVNMLL